MKKNNFIVITAIVAMFFSCFCGNFPVSAAADGNADPWQEFAITRFLTDTNRNGQIPGDTLEVPGALPAVEQIPVADQSQVGETVMIVFAQTQQAIPFYYSCDANTGAERLVVVVTAERIPLLLVFETQLGGLDVLCEKMQTQTEFAARILAITNISPEEGNIYAYNACRFTDKIPKQEQFDIFENAETPQYGKYMGIFGTHSSGAFLSILKGNATNTASIALQNNFAVFERIFERFSLNTVVGLLFGTTEEDEIVDWNTVEWETFDLGEYCSDVDVGMARFDSWCAWLENEATLEQLMEVAKIKMGAYQAPMYGNALGRRFVKEPQAMLAAMAQTDAGSQEIVSRFLAANEAYDAEQVDIVEFLTDLQLPADKTEEKAMLHKIIGYAEQYHGVEIPRTADPAMLVLVTLLLSGTALVMAIRKKKKTV